MPDHRLPPLQGLLAFDALARLRSVTLAGAELSVTPSAVSHRIRQLEAQLGLKLFARSDFSLSPDGADYLARVRQALALLRQVPGRGRHGGRTRLRVAVTPTFSRQLLLPRLAEFRTTYPEIELVLQVSLPVMNTMIEEADLELCFGTGPFAGRESQRLHSDLLSPVCSPDYLREQGPFGEATPGGGFDTLEAITRAQLIRCPVEPWRSWFSACGLPLDEPLDGSQFNDIGLLLDGAAAGFGVALMRLELGRSWLDSGRLVRLSERSVPSPHHYFVCWKPGQLDRWECAAFVDWLRTAFAVD